jgi:hypothetical protein
MKKVVKKDFENQNFKLTEHQIEIVKNVLKVQGLQTEDDIISNPNFKKLNPEMQDKALNQAWSPEKDGLMIMGVLDYYQIDPRQKGVVYFVKRGGISGYSLDYNYELARVRKKYPEVLQVVGGVIVMTKKQYALPINDSYEYKLIPKDAIVEKPNYIHIPEFEELIGAWSQIVLENGKKSEKHTINWSEIANDSGNDMKINKMHSEKPVLMLRKACQRQILYSMFSDVLKPTNFEYSDKNIEQAIDNQAFKITESTIDDSLALGFFNESEKIETENEGGEISETTQETAPENEKMWY